jgi:hypothetical protein
VGEGWGGGCESTTPLRPRDLALLLLASQQGPPRQRARDQQADRAGLQLWRHILDRLAALDPEPHELDATLARIVSELGPGGARALALMVREEWQAACMNPAWLEHLVDESIRQSEERGEQASS